MKWSYLLWKAVRPEFGFQCHMLQSDRTRGTTGAGRGGEKQSCSWESNSGLCSRQAGTVHPRAVFEGNMSRLSPRGQCCPVSAQFLSLLKTAPGHCTGHSGPAHLYWFQTSICAAVCTGITWYSSLLIPSAEDAPLLFIQHAFVKHKADVGSCFDAKDTKSLVSKDALPWLFDPRRLKVYLRYLVFFP